MASKNGSGSWKDRSNAVNDETKHSTNLAHLIIKAYQSLSREKKDEYVEMYIEMSQKTFSVSLDEHILLLSRVGTILDSYDETRTAKSVPHVSLIVDLTSDNEVTNHSNTDFNKDDVIDELCCTSTPNRTENINVCAAKSSFHQSRNSNSMDQECDVSKSPKENLKSTSQIPMGNVNSILSNLGSKQHLNESSLMDRTSSSMPSSFQKTEKRFLEEPKSSVSRKHKFTEEFTVSCFWSKKFKQNAEDKQATDGKQRTEDKQNGEDKHCAESNQYDNGKRNDEVLKNVKRFKKRRCTTFYHPLQEKKKKELVK